MSKAIVVVAYLASLAQSQSDAANSFYDAVVADQPPAGGFQQSDIDAAVAAAQGVDAAALAAAQAAGAAALSAAQAQLAQETQTLAAVQSSFAQLQAALAQFQSLFPAAPAVPSA